MGDFVTGQETPEAEAVAEANLPLFGTDEIEKPSPKKAIRHRIIKDFTFFAQEPFQSELDTLLEQWEEWLGETDRLCKFTRQRPHTRFTRQGHEHEAGIKPLDENAGRGRAPWGVALSRGVKKNEQNRRFGLTPGGIPAKTAPSRKNENQRVKSELTT